MSDINNKDSMDSIIGEVGRNIYDDTKRNELIARLSNIKQNDVTVEKYRIDRMIESGLIAEQNQETVSKNKMIDYAYELLKDNRFWYILVFTALMFNSYNFWTYLTLQLTLGK